MTGGVATVIAVYVPPPCAQATPGRAAATPSATTPMSARRSKNPLTTRPQTPSCARRYDCALEVSRATSKNWGVSFDPYLPRLVREWDGGVGPRELDGTLVSVDL